MDIMNVFNKLKARNTGGVDIASMRATIEDNFTSRINAIKDETAQILRQYKADMKDLDGRTLPDSAIAQLELVKSIADSIEQIKVEFREYNEDPYLILVYSGVELSIPEVKLKLVRSAYYSLSKLVGSNSGIDALRDEITTMIAKPEFANTDEAKLSHFYHRNQYSPYVVVSDNTKDFPDTFHKALRNGTHINKLHSTMTTRQMAEVYAGVTPAVPEGIENCTVLAHTRKIPKVAFIVDMLNGSVTHVSLLGAINGWLNSTNFMVDDDSEEEGTPIPPLFKDVVNEYARLTGNGFNHTLVSFTGNTPESSATKRAQRVYADYLLETETDAIKLLNESYAVPGFWTQGHAPVPSADVSVPEERTSYSWSSVHPHLGENSKKACLGNAGTMFSLQLAEMNYTGLALVAMEFLSTCNLEDSAGKRFSFFPTKNMPFDEYYEAVKRMRYDKINSGIQLRLGENVKTIEQFVDEVTQTPPELDAQALFNILKHSPRGVSSEYLKRLRTLDGHTELEYYTVTPDGITSTNDGLMLHFDVQQSSSDYTATLLSLLHYYKQEYEVLMYGQRVFVIYPDEKGYFYLKYMNDMCDLSKESVNSILGRHDDWEIVTLEYTEEHIDADGDPDYAHMIKFTSTNPHVTEIIHGSTLPEDDFDVGGSLLQYFSDATDYAIDGENYTLTQIISKLSESFKPVPINLKELVAFIKAYEEDYTINDVTPITMDDMHRVITSSEEIMERHSNSMLYNKGSQAGYMGRIINLVDIMKFNMQQQRFSALFINKYGWISDRYFVCNDAEGNETLYPVYASFNNVARATDEVVNLIGCTYSLENSMVYSSIRYRMLFDAAVRMFVSENYGIRAACNRGVPNNLVIRQADDCIRVNDDGTSYWYEDTEQIGNTRTFDFTQYDALFRDWSTGIGRSAIFMLPAEALIQTNIPAEMLLNYPISKSNGFRIRYTLFASYTGALLGYGEPSDTLDVIPEKEFKYAGGHSKTRVEEYLEHITRRQFGNNKPYAITYKNIERLSTRIFKNSRDTILYRVEWIARMLHNTKRKFPDGTPSVGDISDELIELIYEAYKEITEQVRRGGVVTAFLAQRDDNRKIIPRPLIEPHPGHIRFTVIPQEGNQKGFITDSGVSFKFYEALVIGGGYLLTTNSRSYRQAVVFESFDILDKDDTYLGNFKGGFGLAQRLIELPMGFTGFADYHDIKNPQLFIDVRSTDNSGRWISGMESLLMQLMAIYGTFRRKGINTAGLAHMIKEHYKVFSIALALQEGNGIRGYVPLSAPILDSYTARVLMQYVGANDVLADKFNEAYSWSMFGCHTRGELAFNDEGDANLLDGYTYSSPCNSDGMKTDSYKATALNAVLNKIEAYGDKSQAAILASVPEEPIKIQSTKMPQGINCQYYNL